jgi:hypothetical protein
MRLKEHENKGERISINLEHADLLTEIFLKNDEIYYIFYCLLEKLYISLVITRAIKIIMSFFLHTIFQYSEPM